MARDKCLNCGAKVPLKALACPECGACEKTGWSESSEYDSFCFVGDEFQYDDFIEREFSKGGILRGKRLNLIFRFVSVLLVLFLLILLW